MGTSSTAIFDDDTAVGVRDDFLRLLRNGLSSDDATKSLTKTWAAAISDTDDGPVFWLALAATQWSYGCLGGDVQQNAVEVIDSGADLARWNGPFLERRRAVLDALKAKVLSPQPKPKRPRKLKQPEPVPSIEVLAPDGMGKAVAFSMPGASFMQVYLERLVGTSRGGGGVFLAECAYDAIDMEWLLPNSLQITYPAGVIVQQRSESHFYCGEIINIVYRTKLE
jgi:hypothetical protein